MEKGKKSKALKVASIIWFSFAAIILIIRVILLGQYLNLVTVVFAAVIGLVVRKHYRLFINILAIVGIFLANFNFVGILFFESINRKDPLTPVCYSVNVRYARVRFGHEYEVFPDKLPKGAHDVSYVYLPSMLQGTGHMCLFFETSDENIDCYLSEYSEETAVPVFTLDEYENDELPFSLEDYAGDVSNPSLSFYIPKEICEKYPDAEVYVIESNFDWNHQYTTCFYCDRESGMVGFSEGG